MANTALEQAASIISDAREALKSLLETEHNILFVGMNARLTQMQNQLAFASGSDLVSAAPAKFEPVTDFMGEKIERAKKIEASDLSPKEMEKKLLQDKINSLQKELPNLTNEQILESYMNDQIVIRGIAKRAGLDNYRDSEINSTFLDEIRTGFNQQAKDAAAAEKDASITKDNLLG